VSLRELRNLNGIRLTANAAQLSIRDLRLRPLRPMVEAPAPSAVDSPLEAALKQYLDSL
jgi:hypothetical protein